MENANEKKNLTQASFTLLSYFVDFWSLYCDQLKAYVSGFDYIQI